MSIFFRFSGRFNRQPFLILCLALLGLYMVFSAFYLILVAAALGGLASLGASGSLPDLASVNSGLLVLMSVVGLIFVVAMFISSLSISVRRLHDRDKSGWWLLAFYMVGFVLGGVGVYMLSIENFSVYFVTLAIQVVLGLWLLIELCFLRGTHGPNSFGADPLGATADPELFGR